jgi:hypothetical protein
VAWHLWCSTVTYEGFASRIAMVSRFDHWVYWHFFAITAVDNRSLFELLLNDVWFANLSPLLNLGLVSTLTTLISLYSLNFLCYPVGCHGKLVFSNLLLVATNSLIYIVAGAWFPKLLLSNGRLALAPLFRLSGVTLTKQQESRTEAAEMRCPKAAAGYKTPYRERSNRMKNKYLYHPRQSKWMPNDVSTIWKERIKANLMKDLTVYTRGWSRRRKPYKIWNDQFWFEPWSLEITSKNDLVGYDRRDKKSYRNDNGLNT